MNLQDYFDSRRGTGILSTANSNGRVNAAIYARPHIMDDGSVAFIMADRLTRSNLKDNPMATYLFIEEGQGYHGKRLYMTKVREVQDRQLIDSLRRRSYSLKDKEKIGPLFLVSFRLDKELPLIGEGPQS